MRQQFAPLAEQFRQRLRATCVAATFTPPSDRPATIAGGTKGLKARARPSRAATCLTGSCATAPAHGAVRARHKGTLCSCAFACAGPGFSFGVTTGYYRNTR